MQDFAPEHDSPVGVRHASSDATAASPLLLLDQRFEFTPQETRTHRFCEFDVPEGLSRITIDTSYMPKVFHDRKKALELALESVRRYDLDRNQIYGKPVEELPDLLNLIIISADMNGRYLGAAHRHARRQHLVLSPEESSPGFRRTRIEPGTARITVSVFLVLSERCTFRVRVSGIPEQEKAVMR